MTIFEYLMLVAAFSIVTALFALSVVLRAAVGKGVWGDTSIIARIKVTLAMAACASFIGCQTSPAFAGVVGTVSEIVQAGAAVSSAVSMSEIAEAQKATAENIGRPATSPNWLLEKENPLSDTNCVNCHKPIFSIRDFRHYGFDRGELFYCFGKLYCQKHRNSGRIKAIFCEEGREGSWTKCYSGTSEVFRNPHKELEE